MGSLLLVANQGEATLTLIDPFAAKPVAVISEDAVTGHEVAASPDGRFAFVPIYGDSGVGLPGHDGHTLLVIDLRSREITHTIDLGRGLRPHCVRYDCNSSLLYVTTELDQSITIVDPGTLGVVGRVPTAQAESHMLALSKEGGIGYTANVGPGTISILDMRARRTLAVVPVASRVQRIAVSNDDRFIFTSDGVQPRMAVIEAAAQKIIAWIDLPGRGFGATSTLDGRFLLVAIPEGGKVALVDLATLEVAHTIDVPGAPQEILVRPDGRIAYVSCYASMVAGIDTSAWAISQVVAAGQGADGLAWAGP